MCVEQVRPFVTLKVFVWDGAADHTSNEKMQRKRERERESLTSEI